METRTDPASPPAEAPEAGRRGEAWLAFLAAFALLAAFAGVRDLWDADEGRYAAVALDMARSGDLVTPREAGMRFMDKPPLVYWMEVGAFAVLGPTPFAARLPCLLAGAALCAIVFLLGLAWVGERRAAWLAALSAATSAAAMLGSRTVTMDMPLAACIAGALCASSRAVAGGGPRATAALGLAVGLGLLAKGPLAAVVPLVVAVGWAVVGVPVGRLARVASSPLAWGVALLVAGPWYALCEAGNPGYLAHFLLYEHFGRFAKEGSRQFSPVWLYVPVLLLGLLPWTHLLLGARARRPVEVGAGRRVPAERLAWAWVLACLAFYSAGRAKLFTYILPAFPPLFVLAGARLSERLGAGEGAARRLGWWAFTAGAFAAAAGALFAAGVPFDRGWIREAGWRPVALPAAFCGLGLLAAPIALRVLRRPAPRAAFLVLATAALWWGLDLSLSRADGVRSARALAEFLVRERRSGDVVVVLDRYPQGLRFYGPFDAPIDARIAENPFRPGEVHTQPEIVEPWASRDGAGRLLTMSDLRDLWRGPARVLLVARAIDADAEFPGARRLASGLAGAQRSDLVVVESRPR